MAREPRRSSALVGPMLDALDVRVRLDDHQHLVEAMVIGKVVDLRADPCHSTSMIIATSGGLDWIEQRGLLGGAIDILAADTLRGSFE